MNSQLFSWSTTSLVSLFVTTLIFVELPVSLCGDDGYSSCSDNMFNCGAITNVGYPFWGADRPDVCGNPQLLLICEKNVTSIDIMNVKYRVLEMDSITKSLRIAREDYMDGLCSPNLVNSTLDSKLFSNVTLMQNLSVVYGCKETPPEIYDYMHIYYENFTCPVYGQGFLTVDDDEPEPCLVTVLVLIPSAISRFNLSQMEGILREGFDVKWKEDSEACSACTRSKGACGYDLTTNETTCYCPNLSYGSKICHFSSPPPSQLPAPQVAQAPQVPPATPGSKHNLSIKVVIGASAGVAGITLISILVVYKFKRECLCLSRRQWSYGRKTKHEQKVETFIRNYGSLAPKRYSYWFVKKVTNSFINKVGQGGYGVVYKGTLPDGRLVAVKVLSESKGNGEDFINEVASISRTSHVNVVTLLGFCFEKTKRALIYEYMSNGSLDKFIYNQGLEWKTCYEITVGIARGLEYLHRGCNTRILHLDIKPHNILLDENFRPKISDFGLAKLCERKDSVVSTMNARGTIGYVAPEVHCRNIGRVSPKSDVYSYGMMVLEIVAGRKNIDVGVSRTSELYFPHYIYKHLEVGKDLRLDGVTTEEEEEIARKMILISLWCIQTIPSVRPSMTKVVEMLEGSVQSLPIPPNPFLSSPTRSP